MKKRIMILGAGVYQVPLIEKAKEMGLETVVVSPKGEYPGIPLADVFLNIDTTDAGRVLSAAREHDIAGILTTGSDVSVPTIGAVVDALGVRGPTKRMADTVSSKTAFRSFLKESNLNCPEFRICKTAEDAWIFYQALETKAVIKPDDSSGSRGVTILPCGASREDVAEAYQSARNFSRSGTVCAEAFIEGVEVGGDAFFVDGDIRSFSITCKHMAGVVVRGHSLPGNLPEEKSALVKAEVGRVASTLGYNNGPVNFDVMLNGSRVTVLEMGLRNGGNGILDVIKHSEGVDLAEWLVEYSLGMDIPDRDCFEAESISSYVFGSDRAGTLKSVAGLLQLMDAVPEVFELVLAHKPGNHVEPYVHNANLVGYVLLRCGAREYEEVTARVRNLLQIEVEK